MWLIKIIDFLSGVVAPCLTVWAIYDYNQTLLIASLLMVFGGQWVVFIARRKYGYEGSLLVTFLDTVATWSPWPW